MEGDTLKWMNCLRQLIDEKKLNHTFWCFNANSGDTGGLVKDDFKTWDEEKYGLVKKVLWQNDSGKFVGLDHKVPLGANGISLTDFSGKIVRAESAPSETEKQTESVTAVTEDETAVQTQTPETSAAPDEKVKLPSSNVRRVVLSVIIITVSIGVCILAVYAGIRAAASKTADDGEDSHAGDDAGNGENG